VTLAERDGPGHAAVQVDPAARWRYRVGVAGELELQTIRARLSQHAPRRFTGEATRRAAVSAILRPALHDVELLLIRRAEREGDPWSGHMALPGGHLEPSDPDLLATARRETREEVGLDLGRHELLGALDEHPAASTGMVIAPFVFALRSAAELRPNHEVAEVLWAPLGPMARGEVDVVKELVRDGRRVRLPGYEVGERVVWGLTYRVLQNMFAALQESER
jgi:8-oxo-dGTP pyrophosphatase MutT (NUDIX family)